MPVDVNELINLVAEVCENRDLKATLKGSVKGGLICGSSSVVGGLLLGPIGLAIGGAVGGILAAVSSKNSFQSVATIIKEMPQKQKLKLYGRLVHAFRDFGIQDLVEIAALAYTSYDLQDLIIKEVSKYLQNEMNLRIQ